MANLVDVFTQTSGLKSETTVLGTSEDLPKDKPSLFDSLLKTSIEEIESSKNSSTQNKKSEEVSQSITSNSTNNSLDSEVLEIDTKTIEQTDIVEDVNLDENIENEKITKEPIKEIQNSATSKNSFLDRLILEVKNSNLEQANKSEQTLGESLKSIENSDLSTDDKGFVKSLDEIVKELKKENKIEEKVDTKEIAISKNGVLVEVVEQEIITKDEDKNSTKIENINTKIVEVLTPKTEEEIKNDIKSSLVLQSENAENGENILVKKDIKIEEKNIINEVVKSENGIKVEQKLSLMDQLIQANSQKDVTKKITESIKENPQNIEQVTKNSKEISSNIFLADQKNSLNNQLLFNKNEAINILKNGSSVEDIEKSAVILDLETTSLEIEQNISKSDLKDLSADEKEKIERNNILNNILNEKNIRSVDVRNLITNSIEASKALLEDTIKIVDDKVLTLEPNFANSIQSRIVGAKQHLASMMSDVARQMYENYKPPVTVFRMNINPENLGTISILMKQDRASGLTINMSVTSLATLELLMENQNMLRNSLMKTFNDNSNFNLDFSKGGDSGDRSQSSKDGSKQRDRNRDNTEAILKLKEENRDFEDKNDYM